MKTFIHQAPVFLIKKLFLSLAIVLALTSCQSSELKQMPKTVTLLTKKGAKVKTILAISNQDQMTGLSGTPSKSFKADDAMLFFNLETRTRNFWMPDTYFDLDIFFLDENLKVLDVERNVPHHPGWGDRDNIPKVRPVVCRHVLEMRADSDLSKTIRKGDVLELDSISVQQIEQGIRRGL